MTWEPREKYKTTASIENAPFHGSIVSFINDRIFSPECVTRAYLYLLIYTVTAGALPSSSGVHIEYTNIEGEEINQLKT